MRVVVNNTPRPVGDDSAAVIERQRIQVSGCVPLTVASSLDEVGTSCTIFVGFYPEQDTAEGMLRSVLEKIFEAAGSSIDHVPPVMYEFEIETSKKVDDRENVYSRVSNMPTLINLSN